MSLLDGDCMNLLSDFDLNKEQVHEILDLSTRIKANPGKYGDSMKNKTLIMLFELASLRTRISFEAGMNRLGGHAIFYSIEGGKFTRSETLEDGVKNLNKYVDAVMIRALKQDAVERIGAAATIPIINGMTETYHPCQNLADLLTIQEYKGKLAGLKIAYVGDGGCNTAASTMIGCSSVGMEVTVVCPENPKYSPSPEILRKIKDHSGGEVEVSHNSDIGVVGADILYTDVWISAGMEEEAKLRMKAFPPFQVDLELLKKAQPDCSVKRSKDKVDLSKDPIVMHCLPAHRGYEITDEIMDSPYSVVFEQAGNRMHAQNGLLLWLLSDQ
ncbi:ornithine carbamoyltransferase [Candidatus Bathyarchaeota archaeon]|jgi:ornithine carbamoyltransferase|nr:ornithine carbamoyltransferase [Candidatus Bathyarchaeota archaeon]|tara:strand:+ start:3320 stop:4303 length:984 start_codon:yes stop_codon:yes gene_type:complete